MVPTNRRNTLLRDILARRIAGAGRDLGENDLDRVFGDLYPLYGRDAVLKVFNDIRGADLFLQQRRASTRAALKPFVSWTRAEAERAIRSLRDAIAADLAMPPVPGEAGQAARDLLGPKPATEWERAVRLLFVNLVAQLGTATEATQAVEAVLLTHPGSGRRQSPVEQANTLIRKALKPPAHSNSKGGRPTSIEARATRAMWKTDQEIRTRWGEPAITERTFAARQADATGERSDTIRKRLRR